MKTIKFHFREGEMILKMPALSKTYIHYFNDHKLKATKYDGPAPWLGNAVGGHPKPFSFIQAYCETCKSKHGIMYLDKFNDITGESEDKPLTEKEAHEEVEKYINNR